MISDGWELFPVISNRCALPSKELSQDYPRIVLLVVLIAALRVSVIEPWQVMGELRLCSNPFTSFH